MMRPLGRLGMPLTACAPAGAASAPAIVSASIPWSARTAARRMMTSLPACTFILAF